MSSISSIYSLPQVFQRCYSSIGIAKAISFLFFSSESEGNDSDQSGHPSDKFPAYYTDHKLLKTASKKVKWRIEKKKQTAKLPSKPLGVHRREQ